MNLPMGEKRAFSTTNQPLETKNFRVFALRAAFKSASDVRDWGFAINIGVSFDTAAGNNIEQPINLNVSEFFDSESEFVFYNFENMIISGADFMQVESVVRIVAGEAVTGDRIISATLELFYEPIRY
jgi:hypothetical protein